MNFFKSALLISLLLLNLGNGIAQNETSVESTVKENKDFLAGLTKADMRDLKESQLMIDGESIPVYMFDGSRLRGPELMEVFMSGDFTPEPYVDEQKELQAFVMREATPEEKEQMKRMQRMTQGKSEMVGQDAAPFSVTDLKGNQYSLEELKGKIVVLNFWFIACKPCIMEMPDLNELVAKYEGKDVVFLAIAMDGDSDLEKFLEKTPFDYQIIPSGSEIANKYEVLGFPTHVVIDQGSKISFMTSGLSNITVQSLDKNIEESLNK